MLPGIQFALESLKIDRTKERNIFRILFVLLFFFRYWSLTNSIGDRNFSALLDKFRSDISVQEGLLNSISDKHMLTFGISLALFMFAVFVALFYASSFVTEMKRYPHESKEMNPSAVELVQTARETYHQLLDAQEEIRLNQESEWGNRSPQNKRDVFVWQETQAINEPEFTLKKMEFKAERGAAGNSIRWLAKRFFSLSIYFLLGLLLFVISLPLFSIPFLIALFMFLFVPFYLLQGYSLNVAFAKSNESTHGLKLLMFMQSVTLFFLFSLLGTFILTVFEGHYFSMSLMNSFLFSLRTLAVGRLWALLFLVYADLVRRKGRFPSSQL